MTTVQSSPRVALITGSARRVGASLAKEFHKHGYNILIHYHQSATDALQLTEELNSLRANSAHALHADLSDMNEVESLADAAQSIWGQIDLLINNASAFFPTPVEQSSQSQWDELINSKLRAPYFLSSALANNLKKQNGCIINMIDIHAQRGLPAHPIYSIAKAGLQMMTMSLAKELAPHVRVNGISPGAILWPEAELSQEQKDMIIEKTLLKRCGSAEDLAQAALFLAEAPYITGQILAVDGGKSLFSR